MRKTDDVVVEMRDGTQWAVPLLYLAMERVRLENAQERSEDSAKGEESATSAYPDYIRIMASLEEPDELAEWARKNFRWDQVVQAAECVFDPQEEDVDYQDGWENGSLELKFK